MSERDLHLTGVLSVISGCADERSSESVRGQPVMVVPTVIVNYLMCLRKHKRLAQSTKARTPQLSG